MLEILLNVFIHTLTIDICIVLVRLPYGVNKCNRVGLRFLDGALVICVARESSPPKQFELTHELIKLNIFSNLKD
jgi:hypothetical protein